MTKMSATSQRFAPLLNCIHAFSSEEELIEFAKKQFAPLLSQGDIVCLSGDLGAGKTTFTRGIVSGLGGDPAQVSSPTFTLVQEYICKSGLVQHADFYRLPQDSDLEDLGGLEFFDPEKITIIEWFDRTLIFSHMQDRPLIYLKFLIDKNGRNLVLRTA
jgi:tRNA threonylcarbamoyladenosine biosynthesis protein TsaE